jgi:hypothetical protein
MRRSHRLVAVIGNISAADLEITRRFESDPRHRSISFRKGVPLILISRRKVSLYDWETIIATAN